MKTIYQRTAWTLLMMTFGLAAMGQENVIRTLRRMINDYPSAHHRMEYRYAPADSGRTLHELRFDFRIKRDKLRSSDHATLMKLYAKAWDAADPKTDCMQKYAHRDSICSTIVYGTNREKNANLLQHNGLHRFWGNPGYLLFDAGKEISMVADKLEHTRQQPHTACFDDILAAADSLCKNHKTTESAIRYTGSKGPFICQRGKGKGWTRGRKYAIDGCDRTDFNRLRTAFMNHFEAREAINIMVYNNEIILKNEQGPEALLASFSDDGTIYFLSATVEDEICIPENWEQIDCYNNGPVDFVDISRLDSLYEKLRKRSSIPPVAVQYTGGYTREIPAFEWQRGWGTGWTQGYRLELSSITPDEMEEIINVFNSYKGQLNRVNVGQNSACTYEEGTRTFYGFRKTDDGKAFFIRATTENEICIPSDWTERNYYKGTENSAGNSISALADVPKYMQYLYGLGQLWSGARHNFVFMDSVSVNWDSLYIAMMPQMIKAGDDRQALQLLQKMAASLHDGHTYVFGLNKSTCAAPISTKRIEGHVYIDAVLSSHLQEQGIRRGQEIIAINGMPVDEYVNKFIMPYACSSTPQWTEHICYEGHNLMKWEIGEKVVWTLKDGERKFDYNYKSGTEKWDLQPTDTPLSFSVLDNNTGYLKISSFNDYRVTELFDSIYPKLLDTQSLIIDIRGNGGGNTTYSQRIVTHFATDTIRSSSWQSPMYIPAFVSWGYNKMWHRNASMKILPAKGTKIYSRPVALLVDNGTFSAAEDFCALFLSMKRGKLIGSKTGGSTGNGVRIELIPGIAMANICSKHDTAADGTEFVGHGFTPDISVEETYQSYFIDKHDAAITAALKVLADKKLQK